MFKNVSRNEGGLPLIKQFMQPLILSEKITRGYDHLDRQKQSIV